MRREAKGLEQVVAGGRLLWPFKNDTVAAGGA